MQEEDINSKITTHYDFTITTQTRDRKVRVCLPSYMQLR